MNGGSMSSSKNLILFTLGWPEPRLSLSQAALMLEMASVRPGSEESSTNNATIQKKKA
jgi:hypothetical protein